MYFGSFDYLRSAEFASQIPGYTLLPTVYRGDDWTYVEGFRNSDHRFVQVPVDQDGHAAGPPVIDPHGYLVQNSSGRWTYTRDASYVAPPTDIAKIMQRVGTPLPGSSTTPYVTSTPIEGRPVVDVGLPGDPWVTAGNKAAADIAAGGGSVVWDPTSPTGTKTVQSTPGGDQPGPAPNPNEGSFVPPSIPAPSGGSWITWALVALVGIALVRKGRF